MSSAALFEAPDLLANLHDLRDQALASGEPLSLGALVAAGIDPLPLPGSGHTLARWRVLAEVAAIDLSLAKLFEGHTDALAILAELEGPAPSAGSCWGTWCAEPPDARVVITANGAGQVMLHGTKAWCSGAPWLTHAVVSGWNDAGEPCLAAVDLRLDGVHVTGDGWPAVGMAASASVNVRFEHAPGVPLGGPCAYVRRPGFWHGGAGIAACWWGGALGVARAVRGVAQRQSSRPDTHRLAHLGAIDTALAASAALLRECAAWIDARPGADAQAQALRARLAVEQAAQEVLLHAGRALGAGPLCRDAALARAMADLPVYLRQSHAERDQAALGGALLEVDEALPWSL